MNWALLATKLAAQGLPELARAMSKATTAAPTGLAIARSIGAAEATPEVLEQAVDAADPTDMLALRQLEAELERERMAYTERMADRDAADVERVRAAFQGSVMPAVVFGVLSLMVTAFMAAVFVLPYLLGGNLSAEQWDFVKFFGPMLFSAWLAACAYFVGSSAGSAAKDARLAERK